MPKPDTNDSLVVPTLIDKVARYYGVRDPEIKDDGQHACNLFQVQLVTCMKNVQVHQHMQ